MEEERKEGIRWIDGWMDGQMDAEMNEGIEGMD